MRRLVNLCQLRAAVREVNLSAHHAESVLNFKGGVQFEARGLPMFNGIVTSPCKTGQLHIK